MLTTQRRFKPSGLSASRALETTVATLTTNPPAAPPAPPSTPPTSLGSEATARQAGLRKISFAKPAKKADTKTAYPVFSEPENSNAAKQVFEIAGGAVIVDSDNEPAAAWERLQQVNRALKCELFEGLVGQTRRLPLSRATALPGR
jgi:hypothetical protein